jgi:hypothetical protein
VLPVVETSSLHLLVVERKAERFDEVQGCSGCQARPADVAGIPVNLGMNKDDVDASY